jgi:hypothetical protein
MAAITLLGTATFNTTAGTHTVTATPAVGDLIVIVVANSGITTVPTVTDNNSSGTYTAITSARKGSNVDIMHVFVRNALVGAASSTVFTATGASSTGGGLAVLKVTGMSRFSHDAALRWATQENQAAATPAPALAAAVATGNPVIGAVFNATNPATMTPRASPAYTERADVGYATPTTGLEVMSIDSGETASTITWGSASATAFCSIAVELDATALPALPPGSLGTMGVGV